jgi:hypothetical protein
MGAAAKVAEEGYQAKVEQGSFPASKGQLLTLLSNLPSSADILLSVQRHALKASQAPTS